MVLGKVNKMVADFSQTEIQRKKQVFSRCVLDFYFYAFYSVLFEFG